MPCICLNVKLKTCSALPCRYSPRVLCFGQNDGSQELYQRINIIHRNLCLSFKHSIVYDLSARSALQGAKKKSNPDLDYPISLLIWYCFVKIYPRKKSLYTHYLSTNMLNIKPLIIHDVDFIRKKHITSD